MATLDLGSVIGPQGIQGEQGEQGLQGETGQPGVTLAELNTAIASGICSSWEAEY